MQQGLQRLQAGILLQLEQGARKINKYYGKILQTVAITETNVRDAFPTNKEFEDAVLLTFCSNSARTHLCKLLCGSGAVNLRYTSRLETCHHGHWCTTNLRMKEVQKNAGTFTKLKHGQKLCTCVLPQRCVLKRSVGSLVRNDCINK